MPAGRPTLYDPAYCEVVVETMREGTHVKAIPISAAKKISEAYGYDQVVIYARRVGPSGVEHMTTYGATRQHCEVAASMGDTLKRFMGWDLQ